MTENQKSTLSIQRKKNLLFYLNRDKYLYLLGLPGILFFLIFKYGPMFGIMIAFQDYSLFKGFMNSPWVGFKHFKTLFTNPDFPILLRNTLAINVLNLILYFPVPIILALMLNELKHDKLKRMIQTVIYLPHFLSWVIICGLTYLLFSRTQGIVNLLIDAAGMEKIEFLTNPNTFWLMLVGQNIWKESGWGTVIFLAAIAGVNTELYEAA